MWTVKTSDFFWKTIPRTSLIVLLLGVFFIFSIIGSAIDVVNLGRSPMWSYVVSTLLFGVFAICYAASGFILREQFWKVMIPLMVVEMFVLGRILPSMPKLSSNIDLEHVHNRMILDAAVVITGMVLGYICFIYVFVSEGRRYFSVHAEMELASEIHHVLVPAIETRLGDFEFYGRSTASGQVGGDLIDVFPDKRGWIAYVADVSGHGVAPGVMMGMVKSAARMQLSSGKKSAELLERLNDVLHPIKKPEMFVTFAYVAWDGELLEFSTAAHPAILHYEAATHKISELVCSNLPLSMFAGQRFERGSAPCGRGDVFLMLTDGLLEVANAKGEEFGMEGVRAVLSEHATEPLSKVQQAVLDAAQRYGRAVDDQSLLLVRCKGRV